MTLICLPGACLAQTKIECIHCTRFLLALRLEELSHKTWLIYQGFCALLAVGDDLAAFKAKPVDRAKPEEQDQCEFEDGDLADDVQYWIAGPGGVDCVQCRIGVDVT